MLGEIIEMGVNLATLPARLTWRSARAVSMTPARFRRFTDELRAASDEAARELLAVLAGVDAEMSAKAAHLTPQQKLQAASLALDAAEQHLSMAAVNVLRALWLSLDASRSLQEQKQGREGVIIEHERET